MALDDDQLLRFSRQIMLPELDVVGQEALLAATVLIIGLGGLGSPAALYLAAAGVGRLLLSDDDRVEASNLQRQILHGVADLGRPKTESARTRLQSIAPALVCETFPERLAGDALLAQVRRADVVLDGTDNLASRYAMNRACITAQVPLVSAAAIRFEAQWSTFDFRRPDSPCYRCLWPDAGDDAAQNCAENGVIAPLVGMVGSLQALEAIKLITGIGDTLVGRVQILDGLASRFDSFRLQRRADCPDCAGR